MKDLPIFMSPKSRTCLQTTSVPNYRKGRTKLAILYWIRPLLIVCYAVHSVGSACQSDIINHTEECLRPLIEPTIDTLNGQLTAKTWSTTCATYNTSRQCIEKLIKDCPRMAIEVRETVTEALRTSMGQLCESRLTFQRYLRHAKCYSSQKNITSNCMARFQDQAHAAIMKYDGLSTDEESPNEELCRIYLELNRCIRGTIQTKCGVEAAQLIHGIPKAQVPIQISRHCEEVEPPSSTATQPNLHSFQVHSTPSWITALVTLTLSHVLGVVHT